MIGANSNPSEDSRPSVSVVSRDSTSTSPDCSAVNRFCVVSGENFTLLASPNTAAAMAWQVSASMPFMTPWLSGSENPAVSPAVPHTSMPRAFTASSVCEPLACAWAGVAKHAASAVAAIAPAASRAACRVVLTMIRSS